MLTVKLERERSLRSALALCAQKASELQMKRSTLLQERLLNLNSWRQHSAIEQEVNHTQLQQFKQTLAGFAEGDLAFTEQLDHLHAEEEQLQRAMTEQQLLLHTNLLEQEKLKLMLEQ